MTPSTSGPAPAGGQPGVCPYSVDRPVMRHRWERVTFLHWRFGPATVQRLLPPGLTVDTFDGAAWVGLVPFFMRVATPGGRRIAWVSNFCETNVRTYVRDEAGRAGIWFLSLDAARAGAVAIARASYRLPYYWSRMRIAATGQEVTYRCRRRWPPPRAASEVHVTIGERYRPGEPDRRDHFLTARWMLFSYSGGRLRSALACHPPWPLYHARLRAAEDRLLPAAGLPQPADEPLVHYSHGVEVAIGRPG